MSGPESNPFAKDSIREPFFVLAVEAHLQWHYLETLSWELVLDNTTTTRAEEHGVPWMVIDTTSFDVSCNRSESGIHRESLSGDHLDAQSAIEPVQSIEPGFASSDTVPAGFKALVRYCCRVGFLQLVESVLREDPDCQDASTGKIHVPSSIANQCGCHVFVDQTTCAPSRVRSVMLAVPEAQVLIEAGHYAYKLAMEWIVEESEGAEFNEMNEYLQTLKVKECADIARCAVSRALAEAEDHADHLNPTSEKALAFEDVMNAILAGGTDEAGVDAARAVLAIRGRSLDGGPLRV